VVGLGPGDSSHRTPAALTAIARADVVVGYAPYIDAISGHLAGKEVVRSGMKAEMERVAKALQMAMEGRSVVLVSSGDAGVYGMAGLALEMAQFRGWECPIEVVPGMTAAQAAAAALGAPLMLDWAVVSLSDLMVPWERICRKLSGIAAGDLCCVLYNPRSRGRPELLSQALVLLAAGRSQEIPVAAVREAGGPNQRITRGSLGDFPLEEVDMKCLVVVGDSTTRWTPRGMITPRGYSSRRLP
jgi:precorrin-3B C17-methyltransferase